MNIVIREEQKSDYQRVYEVNKLAFQQEDESRLVDKIRTGQNFIPELSLVSEVEGKIVGHILFSRLKIVGDDSIYDSIALAPMAVIPEYQKKGIGSKLVKGGLKRSKELGFSSVIVLGHSEYYPKFGFFKASKWGIKCPFEVPEEAFMAIELIDGALDGKHGIVQYPDEFYEVE